MNLTFKQYSFILNAKHKNCENLTGDNDLMSEDSDS